MVLCHLTIKFLSLWRLKKPWLTSLWKFFLRVISQWVKISRDEDWDLKKKAWKVLGTERYLHIYPTSIKRILFRDSFPWLFSVTLFRDSSVTLPWLFSVTLFRDSFPFFCLIKIDGWCFKCNFLYLREELEGAVKFKMKLINNLKLDVHKN